MHPGRRRTLSPCDSYSLNLSSQILTTRLAASRRIEPGNYPGPTRFWMAVSNLVGNGHHDCSGRAQDVELLQGGRAVVQADLFRDLAVLDAEHGNSREAHFPTGSCRQ